MDREIVGTQLTTSRSDGRGEWGGRRLACLYVVVAFLSLGDGASMAQPPAPPWNGGMSPRAEVGRPNRSIPEAVEVDSGFLVVEDQYIAPPYVIESKGGRICINGLEVAQMRWRGFRRFPMAGPRTPRPAPGRGVFQIVQHLRAEGLLIRPNGGEMQFLSPEQAISIFEVLMADGSAGEKVRTLIQAEPAVMTADQWVSLVETFEAPPGLADRITDLKEHQAMLELDGAPPWFGRMPMTGATVLGFALAVWALGTLLGCRAPATLDPSDLGETAHSGRQVVRLVVLIVILGVYDLVCTLCAEHVGGLWELNPFAHSLVARTALVTSFKLVLTIGAGLLLVLARRSRLAQVGSWWIGVLYTVLILRWATYNSVFMV